MNEPKSTYSVLAFIHHGIIRRRELDTEYMSLLCFISMFGFVFLYSQCTRDSKRILAKVLSRDTLEQYSKREEVDRAHGIKIIVE